MEEKMENKPLLPALSRDTSSISSRCMKILCCKCLPHCCVPARYLMAITGFFGFVIVFALRVNLSMALVVMVNSSSANASTHLQRNWSSEQQGWVLSAFYIGYTITQIPGGYLASRIGGRYVFGIGVLMAAILTLLTPLAFEIHIGALIALRVMEGLFEGVTFPAMHALLGKWSPPKERSILATITYSGASIGIVVSYPLSAVLCDYGFAGGWPSVFYVFGLSGIVWFFPWILFGFSSPATHPGISEEERKYIESSIAVENVRKAKEQHTPWFSILTSPAVWAIIVAFFCFGWSNFTLLTCAPSYFRDILRLSFGKSLLENGVYSALPYLGFAIFQFISAPLADLLRSKKYLSTTLVRKLFTTAAFLLPASGLFAVGYFGSEKAICVSLLTLISSFGGLMAAGFNINHIDIAPQYAGVLMGITNSVGTIPGILGPLVAETIAHKPSPGQNDLSVYKGEWREVFILAAEINIFGALVYLILAQGERQWWAGGKGEHQKEAKVEPNQEDCHSMICPQKNNGITVQYS